MCRDSSARAIPVPWRLVVGNCRSTSIRSEEAGRVSWWFLRVRSGGALRARQSTAFAFRKIRDDCHMQLNIRPA